MDLFGKRRIKQLEESLEDKERLFNIQQIGWKESNEKLATAKNIIREMDDRIFRISQCTDWNAMRPHIGELISMMESRRRIESDRIGGIILQELNHE